MMIMMVAEKKAQQITYCPILFRWISEMNGVYVHLREQPLGPDQI